MSKITDPEKAAQRARVLASDIALYPDLQELIAQGIRNDTLFEDLEGILREAREHLQAHVSEDLLEETNVWEKAFIDLVFAQTGHIASHIW